MWIEKDDVEKIKLWDAIHVGYLDKERVALGAIVAGVLFWGRADHKKIALHLVCQSYV